MAKRLLVEDHIRRNKRLTIVVCTFMALLFIAVIFAIGYIFFPANPYIGLIFGLPIAVVYVLVTYSFSVKTVYQLQKLALQILMQEKKNY